MINPHEKPATDPVQHDGLDQLSRMAHGVDQELGTSTTSPGMAAPEPAPDVGPEIAAMLQAAVTMATPMMPFLPACYTPEACQRIGVALGAVAEKRGWKMDEMMTPEVALVLVALPPTIQAVVMGRNHFAAQRETPAKLQAPQDAPAPAQEGYRAMPTGTF